MPSMLVRTAFESVLPRIQALIDEQEDELNDLGLRDKIQGMRSI